MLWLSLNTSVGRLVQHPYIYLFLIVDVLPILALFLHSQQQFEKYKNLKPKIYTIPVGNISRLNNEQQRKPYSIITASRLANEKHVDWLIKAVIKAHKINDDIRFDIYGEGSERQKLQQIIDNSNIK